MVFRFDTGMQHIKDRNIREREHFDVLVESTGDVWWGHKTSAGHERLHRRAELARDRLRGFSDPFVLEVGCGTGAFSKHLLEALPSLHLVCCDISPKAVRAATGALSVYGNVDVEEANACSLKYDSSTFDAIVGVSILHHIPVEKAVSECYRVLKPGGVIWFSEPNMLNPEALIELKVHFLGKIAQKSEDETAFIRWNFVKLLKGAGFEDIDVRPFDFLHPFVPKRLIGIIEILGHAAEHIPLLREIAGSLEIYACKPQSK
ncbi:MAG: methyltransferase domain-containing protein [bacterium]|nr:MAG: methyltransferase domain-containing protein [bacterium]